eukprot:763702-Hanusia_phi.AAC.4
MQCSEEQECGSALSPTRQASQRTFNDHYLPIPTIFLPTNADLGLCRACGSDPPWLMLTPDIPAMSHPPCTLRRSAGGAGLPAMLSGALIQ